MRVLVDTSVWSLALRRSAPRNGRHEKVLSELIREGRVAMLGPIRQEILSGVRTNRDFLLLRDRLRAFPDLALDPQDYEEAAICFNRCRAQGIQGSNTDFLICSVSLRHDMPVLTTDKDFDAYARLLSVPLHAVQG